MRYAMDLSLPDLKPERSAAYIWNSHQTVFTPLNSEIRTSSMSSTGVYSRPVMVNRRMLSRCGERREEGIGTDDSDCSEPRDDV